MKCETEDGVRAQNVAVGLVTYNRKALLIDCIAAIARQSHRPAVVTVIDNASTDGTADALRQMCVGVVIADSQAQWSGVFQVPPLQERVPLRYVRMRTNTGSSGGFAEAVSQCYKIGAEWVWLMDDDVRPEATCLEELLKYAYRGGILQPMRVANGGICRYDAMKLNLTQPFRLFHCQVFGVEHMDQECVPAEGIPFEGPLIHRDVIRTIGVPCSDMYICADDTEYCIRALRAGFTINICTRAVLERRIDGLTGKRELSWKDIYMVRNLVYIDWKYGSAAVRMLRTVRYLISYGRRCRSLAEIGHVLRAVFDGARGQLISRVAPGQF